MEVFQVVDQIFSLLKHKHYGKVTDKMVEDGMKDLKEVVADGSQSIKNNSDFIRLYLNHVKAHRFHRVGELYGENEKKLQEIKDWYALKQGGRIDVFADTQKDNDTENGDIAHTHEDLSKEYRGDMGHTINEKLGSQRQEEHYGGVINKEDRMSTEERSREASKKLIKGNPNIVNLSDINRPSKIAERFSELYDNEWTESFIYYSKTSGQDELSSIQLLLNLVTTAYDKCYETAEEDLKLIEVFIKRLQYSGKHSTDIYQLKIEEEPVNSDLGYLRQHRKTTAHLAVNRVIRDFKDRYREMLANTHGTPIDLYVDKCVELCWWMCVQDPPIHMCMPRRGIQGRAFTSAFYRPYTKSGETIDFLVWPLLLLYADGPVLTKGVVQCK